jgi:hypothetical protein
MRAKAYTIFAPKIKEKYLRLEDVSEGTIRLQSPQLEQFLLKAFREHLGPILSGFEADLYTAGLNSLQAIQISHVIKEKSVHGWQCCNNVQEFCLRCGEYCETCIIPISPTVHQSNHRNRV